MTEEAYLALVIEKLHQGIEQLDQKLEDNVKDIESMHDYFWENYSEFDEYGYEMYDNSTALQSRVTEQDEHKKTRTRYQRMLYAPYFGRVDFLYEDEEDPETYYIGIGNFAEKRASEPLVYDWRAPVSGLFYDYDKGPGQFEAPGGLMTGELTRKKQYKIKNGKLIYVLENEMNIDDEILQQALSEHADAKLKSIVTTIQREQNSIIRDVTHRILAVQGCAGSGKTSVALHRIAYLLYHNRNKLKAGQILILSPNSIFGDYISRILPELGEENICEMTLDDYAYRELQEWGEAEDRYDEMEKQLHAGEDLYLEYHLKPDTAEASYKQSKAYVRELDGFVLSLESELVEFKDFSYKKMYLSAREMLPFFYEKLCDVPIFARMHKIGEYLIDAEETLRGKNMEDEEKQIIFEKLNKLYETSDLLSLYQRFLKETGRAELDLTDHMLRYEDVYPMLYLKYAVYEPPKRRTVKHLVIDEMQDYSYLKYRILQKMFDCPMTILGDKIQTMADAQQDILPYLKEIFGKSVYSISLDKSYRSTTEIMEFAAAVLQADVENQSLLEYLKDAENQPLRENTAVARKGGCGLEDLQEDVDSKEDAIQKVENIQRHGQKPEVVITSSEEEMLAQLVQDVKSSSEYDTLAVLCLDQTSADEIGKKLQSLLGTETEVSILSKDSMHFKPGLSVLPFYLAKGLEFDAVFVPDLQKYQTALHKQALYIEATRALHLLRLYSGGR